MLENKKAKKLQEKFQLDHMEYNTCKQDSPEAARGSISNAQRKISAEHSIPNLTKVPHVQKSEPSNYRLKVKCWCQAQQLWSLHKAQEKDLLDRKINLAEDDRIGIAKQDKTIQTKKSTNIDHQPTLKKPTPIMQQGCNLGLALGANLQCTVRKIK